MKSIHLKKWLHTILILLCLLIPLFLIRCAWAGNVTYTYDELNRLIQVTYEDGNTVSYSYDQAGNRLVKGISQETILTPSIPSGPTTGTIGISYIYSTGEASSSFTHSIEYRFDWGDGTYSNWSSSNTASKSWSSAGTYSVSAQARCATHTLTISSKSASLPVTISSPDITPPTPNPMTWVKAPYQTGTNSITMVATAASDPTSPINYFFDFVDSPTQGTGGADSTWQAGTTYANSGLQANHKYGYQVKARDGAINQTAYSTPVKYIYTAIETPTGITFGTISTSSIQVKSTNTPSGLTRGSSGLWLENTTKGTNSGWKQNNDFWSSASLAPNTNYSFRAKAKNGDAVETAFSASVSKYTLANVPGSSSFSNVTQTCIRATWTANGNPGGTQYFSENTTKGTNSGWTTNLYWDSCGLTCGTSYSFRVKAKNGNGVETSWTNLGSKSTLSCGTISITVVSPNGGENWKRGTTQTIRWSYTGNPGSYVKIELLKAGKLNQTISSKISIGNGETGSYNWKIPTNQTTGTDYKIRVTSTNNNSYTDTSNNNFTISQ